MTDAIEAHRPALPATEPSSPPLTRSVIDQSLPGAPHVLPKLLALSDADEDAGELVRLIESDPALTARILRTANSPFFGQARSVTTVQRALVVLGSSMVRNLALGLTVWDAASGAMPIESFVRLWQHSLTVALAARDLAARTALCNPGDAFTAGLLHDTGKLVLARALPDTYPPLVQTSTAAPSLVERERAVVGCDHAQVGGWLFDSWRVPELIVEAVAGHHERTAASPLAALVGATDLLLHHAAAGTPESDPEHQAALARADASGISTDLWREVGARSASAPGW